MELNYDVLKRFIKVQKKIEAFNAYGTFQEMKVHEEKLETTSLLRRQAERDFKVLSDQKKKQKQDLDNIKTKAFRAYFLCDADHEVIIEQEKVRSYLIFGKHDKLIRLNF